MNSPNPSVTSAPRRTRWFLLLLLLWSVLVFRIGVAIVRGEFVGGQPLRDDLALPALALFITSALLGSRVYAVSLRRADAARSEVASRADSVERTAGP